MRIGLFTDTYAPDVNGVVSSILILQRELEKNGHTVFVVTTHSSLFHIQYEDNILRLPGIELKQLYGYVLTSPLHLRAYNNIKEMELDIIHVHTEFGIGIFARIVAKMLSLPLVSTYHTTYEDYTHYVNFLGLNSIDKIAKKATAGLSKLYGESSTEMIAPSSKTKEMLLRYGIKKSIHVVPTGLDLQRFDVSNTDKDKIASIRFECGVKDDQLMVVFVGRIAKEKSIDIIIDGFAELKKQGKNHKLLIVGSGPAEESLKEKVLQLGIQELVCFIGRKESVEIPSYYHSSDVFVSASLTETQGMTFIEALASGLPVFARPDEVLDELIIEKETGFYFKTPAEFAKKLIQYAAYNAEEKQEMRIQAIKHVQPYDSRLFYQKVIQVYESAIHNYSESYEIERIRPKEDCVELLITSNSDDLKIMVSLDMYFQKGLRRNMKIDQSVVDELLEDEEFVKAYQMCLRKLTARDRTCKEMYDWLTQNTELNIARINSIIEKLEERGFINDERYTNSQIINMKLMLQGKNKIIRTLKKKGIPYEMIEKSMSEEDDHSELNNALKLAEKIQPTLREKSILMKKNLIKQKLFIQGYSMDIVQEVIECLSFVSEEKEEIDILRKVAFKAMKRYQNKYSGSKLRNYVFRYLSAQGFDNEDIYVILSEMEWKDE